MREMEVEDLTKEEERAIRFLFDLLTGCDSFDELKDEIFRLYRNLPL